MTAASRPARSGFDLSIDLLEFENAVVIVVPLRKTLVG